MRSLHHFPLCPFSRKLRILLAEKDLPFTLINENYWERRKEFANLNPAMQVPVLSEPDGIVIPDSYAASEYVEGKYPEKKVLGGSLPESAGIRRIVGWFDNKFYNEVTGYILNEKVLRYYTRVGQPSSEAIRAAKTNLVPHVKYIEFLTEEHKWLMGSDLTLADISAAAQISVLDYLGEIDWEKYPQAKEWYALIKSRPSFRSILADKIVGFKPSANYANLDF